MSLYIFLTKPCEIVYEIVQFMVVVKFLSEILYVILLTIVGNELLGINYLFKYSVWY